MENLILIVSIICLIVFVRALNVIIHEFGHAVAAVLLTKQRVHIYIGSYGYLPQSLRMDLGLIELYIVYNPLKWKIGLCDFSARYIPVNQLIIIIFAGPLLSFTLGTIACYFVFAYDLHGAFKLFVVLYLLFVFFELVQNLIPNQTPYFSRSGNIFYNDGFQLKKLFLHRKYSERIKKACEFYNDQFYKEAAEVFEEILQNGGTGPDIYRLAIASFFCSENYNKARIFSEKLVLEYKHLAYDLNTWGLSCSFLDLHEEAMTYYDRAIQIDKDFYEGYANKGYTFLVRNKFEDAISIFDDLIAKEPNRAYSHSNRGLAKLKLGKEEEGLKEINYAISLDSNDSYGYKNLGIYHLDKGNYIEALNLFLKAKELNPSTHMINKLIRETEPFCNK